jgi:hypothetical protein
MICTGRIGGGGHALRYIRAMRKRMISASVIAGLASPLLCLAVSTSPSPEVPQPAAARSAFAGGNGKEPRSLSFIVLRFEKRPGGEFTVTFEDGQVWQQLSRDVDIELTRGEDVVIRRRGGAFVLESRTGLSTRVKRLH